jgi:hypothetical protein
MKNEDVHIRVIDLSGNIVLSETITVTGDKPEHRMDLSSFPRGIYFIRIENNKDRITQKLILQ